MILSTKLTNLKSEKENFRCNVTFKCAINIEKCRLPVEQ